ncbi:MAG: TIGR04255 family protein [Elusimicrobia bacterium]|nr:TIGR04255 family protein [Elusimicrobiota bacterium]
MKYEIYEKSPLIEVVFEMRFPCEPAVECNRDKFYQEIRENYPEVFVPRSFPSGAVALEPYNFRKADGSFSVMISLNKLGISCLKYYSFESFKKETISICRIFEKLFKIEKLNRVGLRYLNMIPFTREKGIIPIGRYLNVGLNLPDIIPAEYQNLSIVFVSQIEKGSITTRIEPFLSQSRAEFIVLDFDYVITENIILRNCENYINDSHQHTKQLFEKLITNDYRNLMRGEVV